MSLIRQDEKTSLRDHHTELRAAELSDLQAKLDNRRKGIYKNALSLVTCNNII